MKKIQSKIVKKFIKCLWVEWITIGMIEKQKTNEADYSLSRNDNTLNGLWCVAKAGGWVDPVEEDQLSQPQHSIC